MKDQLKKNQDLSKKFISEADELDLDNLLVLEIFSFLILKQDKIQKRETELAMSITSSEHLTDGQCVSLHLERAKLRSEFRAYNEIFNKIYKLRKKENGVGDISKRDNK
jgi:hypothetical protein